jgi:4-hydroxyphenylpyruvate dioxygenase-like putative hemolysin
MSDIIKKTSAIYANYPTVVNIRDGVAYDKDNKVVTYNEATVQAYIDANEYKSQRQYPSIGDQLDMLWHAIDNGTLNKTSDFYTAIKAVKDAHPKE